MMEFSLPYQLAMRQQAPRMFNQLLRSGTMKTHLKDKSAEAHRLYDQLAANLPKLPNGLLRSPSDRRAVEEQVFAVFLDFPPHSPQSQNETIPGDPKEPRATTSP